MLDDLSTFQDVHVQMAAPAAKQPDLAEFVWIVASIHIAYFSRVNKC